MKDDKKVFNKKKKERMKRSKITKEKKETVIEGVDKEEIL